MQCRSQFVSLLGDICAVVLELYHVTYHGDWNVGIFPSFSGSPDMSYIGTYLDQLIGKKEFRSDSELATFLEISRQHLSRIRSDGRVLSEELCYRIALELDINPLELFAYVRAQKSKRPEIKAVWMELHRQTKRVKASILLNSN